MQCPYYNFELNRLVNKLTDNIGVGFELETLVRGKSNILIKFIFFKFFIWMFLCILLLNCNLYIKMYTNEL